MDEKTTQTICTHTILDNGIHSFNWMTSSREVLHEYLKYVEQILKTHPPGERLNLLIDIRQGGMPRLTFLSRSPGTRTRPIRPAAVSMAAGLHVGPQLQDAEVCPLRRCVRTFRPKRAGWRQGRACRSGRCATAPGHRQRVRRPASMPERC